MHISQYQFTIPNWNRFYLQQEPSKRAQGAEAAQRTAAANEEDQEEEKPQRDICQALHK
jgi:hypothetical protein